MGPSAAVSPVEKFFEFSLLGLLASGFLAVVGSGYLDTPTIVVTAAALLARILSSAGILRIDLPPAAVTAVTLAYIGFYPIDYFYVSRLPGEPAEGVADLHTHPLERRNFRFSLTAVF